MPSSWKQLLIEANSLTSNNGKNAYRTAQIIKQLVDDKQFLSESCKGSLDDRDSKLAVFSGRFAVGVHDMLAMLNHFPKTEDWKSGRLDLLRDKAATAMIAAERATRSDKGGSHKTSPSDPKKQLAELRKKYTAALRECTKLRREKNNLQRKVDKFERAKKAIAKI